MPGLRVCLDCWRLTPNTRCEQHEQKGGGWHGQHAPAPKRIAGRKLQRLREALFRDEPFCRGCRKRAAEIRDHVVPLAEGGEDRRENTQPLCQECSDAKTRTEARRGRDRMAGGR